MVQYACLDMLCFSRICNLSSATDGGTMVCGQGPLNCHARAFVPGSKKGASSQKCASSLSADADAFVMRTAPAGSLAGASQRPLRATAPSFIPAGSPGSSNGSLFQPTLKRPLHAVTVSSPITPGNCNCMPKVTRLKVPSLLAVYDVRIRATHIASPASSSWYFSRGPNYRVAM